jgi:hypothetical protein
MRAFFGKPQSPLPALASVFLLLLQQPLFWSIDLDPLDIGKSHGMMRNAIMIEGIQCIAGEHFAIATIYKLFLFSAFFCWAVADQLDFDFAALAFPFPQILFERTATSAIKPAIAKSAYSADSAT